MKEYEDSQRCLSALVLCEGLEGYQSRVLWVLMISCSRFYQLVQMCKIEDFNFETRFERRRPPRRPSAKKKSDSDTQPMWGEGMDMGGVCHSVACELQRPDSHIVAY